MFCVEEERYDAEAFLRFLQKVLERYPIGKIVMFYSSVKEIRRNVQAFIRELNDTPEKVIDRLCVQL